jgi:AcrR family transcriptional regulator
MADIPHSDTPAAGQPKPNNRDAAIDALMKLAAERDWREIGLADISREAGISLADLRDAFPSKGAILGGLIRRIDRQVLEGTTADLAEEPARERLFDVLTRRLDAFAPYKAALRRISEDFRRDPLSLAAMNKLALNSHRFMLAAAGINTEGAMGLIKIQGSVCVFSDVFQTWLDDDDPDMARTLARLDRELRSGERLFVCFEDIGRLTAPFRAMARTFRSGRHRSRRRDDYRDRGPGEGEDFAPAI